MLISTVRRSLAVVFPSALGALLAVSCGGKDGSEVNGGDGTSGSSTGTGGTFMLGTAGNGTLTGSSGTGAVMTITRGAACANGTGTADAIPAVVEMVIDISGSMNESPTGMGRIGRGGGGGGMSKWTITRAALEAAVAKLPASIAVGIKFFPNDQCVDDQADLAIDLLGAANSRQRRNFNAAIDGARPNGPTPTQAAYKVGTDLVTASKLMGRKFVLLITDGHPTITVDCKGDGKTPVDDAPLIAAVGAAFKGDPSISTFVIGSPGSEDARADLSQMATLGGTAKAGCSDKGPNYCHLDMTAATDFGAALTAGLADVAGQIGSCDFVIPPAPSGKTLDPKLINVLYTHADGTETSIPQDQTGTCMSGWKYDNDNMPSKITLCGTDCDKVKADQSGKVDVIFGCDTQTNVPVK